MRPFAVEPEYVTLVEPDTLEPVLALTGEALLALAARVGEVRLIDNTILSPVRQPLEGEAIATCSA
jgi:pantoate--beta-alanine ligase